MGIAWTTDRVGIPLLALFGLPSLDGDEKFRLSLRDRKDDDGRCDHSARTAEHGYAAGRKKATFERRTEWLNRHSANDTSACSGINQFSL